MMTAKPPTAAKVRELILDYIIEEMKPLRTVESDSFKRLVTGLCPTATVMTRVTVTQLVLCKYDEMISSLKSKLDGIDVVCTTADLWSSQNRSFLGITLHWLEPKSLERLSAATACKRFTGGHTYDKIAAAIHGHGVHTQFNIDHKVSRTCTDNGSNMVKAFKEFEFKIDTQAILQLTSLPQLMRRKHVMINSTKESTMLQWQRLQHCGI